MKWINKNDRDDFNRLDRGPREHQVAVILDGAFGFAVCFNFASFASHELVAAYLGSLLLIAAVITAVFAHTCRDFIFADRPTYWDVAAVFLFLSFISASLVDSETMRSFLELNVISRHLPTS